MFALAGLLLAAAPAAALEARAFSRATEPHAASLGAALAGVVPGSVHVSYTAPLVTIWAASWAGVSLPAVQAAVDAAPADTPTVRAKHDVDGTHGLAACLVEAFARALLPVLNDARTTPTTVRAAITADQVRTSLKAQIDALGCGE